MTTTFTHLDLGTPEEQWDSDFTLAAAPPAVLPAGCTKLVVLAAHPDDETLGAGGLISVAAASGLRVEVVIATDGEASHPRSTSHSAHRLAQLRRAEAAAALRCLAPTASISFLGLPDGALEAELPTLRSCLRDRIGADVLVVTPWSGDRHPDHAACARAVRDLRAARPTIMQWQYPIWAWHWAQSAAEFPGPAMRRLDLPELAQRRKTAAIGEFRTQNEPLSARPGDEPVLSPQMLAHFRRPYEIYIVDPSDAGLDVSYFDELYAEDDDPWGLQDRFYEQRKRDLLIASLPRRRFRRAFEPGCAIGLLTERLAQRCDSVTAWDFARRALDLAAENLDEHPNVELAQGTVPDQWPEGEFDLIVLSEVGYYCLDLDVLAARVRASLSADGVLLACHWRHPAADHPHTAEAVHAAVGRGMHPLLCHTEADFRLEVWSATPASVAQAEGIVP
ncbi:LmbE family N-acetylglucosaminyl deacetylase [Jatrophihabitans sp. GAS493]|uniref:PIG-L family deacetylase n=1 Tax=Jatrophihabitans sp. GAS493 TaxID=1907575 RepID=UPI000BB973E4|nr:PIG-L family deacetylase [Jatrophihabitans sp. GAS493]SOD74924.1 LmbE family N-acetylglucosaminyl deacetylase [Jatrophihabitans sp. GAS493]